jgi:uncharacterized membrane protein YfcA
MVLALQAVFAICFLGILVDYLMDVNKNHKGELKGVSGGKWAWAMGIGLVANLLDTLGIGSFATSTFLYKTSKSCPDELLPGTLNVGDTFPVIAEALVFTTAVDCDGITLISMCVAAMLGSYLMAGIVCKWDVNKIRYVMGVAMICVAIVMACKNAGVGPFGMVGTATGLTGAKLVVAGVVNFFLGALMDVGFGLYAPCMALLLMLGCDAGATFPIFMSSCALLMPACSIKFIKESKYDVVCVMGNLVGGLVGVLLACTVVTSLPIYALIWVVCVVLVYTSVMMLRDASKATKKA